LGAGPIDILLARDADEGVENRFFISLEMSNGTFGISEPNRLDDVNAQALEVLPRERNLRVLDVGASSGATTAEWSTQLKAASIAHELTMTDLNGFVHMISVDKQAAVLWELDGYPLAVQIGPISYFFRRGRLGDVIRAVLGGPLRGLHKLALDRWAESGADSAPDGRLVLWRLPLVCGRMRSQPEIKVVKEDLLHAPWLPPSPFDVIRAANVLNRSYFDDADLKTIVGTLISRLAPEGLLIVVRTVMESGDINRGTIYKRTDTGLEAVRRFNGGSEIEDLILAEGNQAEGLVRST
jgi:hypothetical protein